MYGILLVCCTQTFQHSDFTETRFCQFWVSAKSSDYCQNCSCWFWSNTWTRCHVLLWGVLLKLPTGHVRGENVRQSVSRERASLHLLAASCIRHLCSPSPTCLWSNKVDTKIKIGSSHKDSQGGHHTSCMDRSGERWTHSHLITPFVRQINKKIIRPFDSIVLDSSRWMFSKFHTDFFWDRINFSCSPLMGLYFQFVRKTVLIPPQCCNYIWTGLTLS